MISRALSRALLRMAFLAIVAGGLAVIGTVLATPDRADAAAPDQPTSGLAVSIGGGTVTVGPVAVDLPVPLPVGEPVAVGVEATIPLPVPALADVPGLDGLGTVPTLPLPPPPIALPVAIDLTELDTPLGAGTTTDVGVRAPQMGGPEALHPARGIRTARSKVSGAPQAMPTSTSSSSDHPTLPSIPWTLGFAGAAAVIATSGGRRAGGSKRGSGPALPAVISSTLAAIPRVIATFGPLRPDPSRPGFALLLARPG